METVINPKIDGFRFSKAEVDECKDFDEFYAKYKGSAYVHPVQADVNQEAKPLNAEVQKKQLQKAWDIMRPAPVAATAKPAANKA